MRTASKLAKYLTFTPTAAQTLEDIALWTTENFGPGQADTYLSSLLNRCDAILRNDAIHRQPASFSHSFPTTPLLLAKAESHFIVFAILDEEYVVFDFFHERSDLIGKLTKLNEKFGASD